MASAATIVHSVSGRTRFKIAAERGNTAYFERLRNAFSQYSDVSAVSVNPMTASVLLNHDAPIEQIVTFAQQRGLFELNQAQPTATAVTSVLGRLAEQANWLDANAITASRGALDSRSLLFLALLGLIALQLARGQVLGPASSLLWYVLELLRNEGWGKR